MLLVNIFHEITTTRDCDSPNLMLFVGNILTITCPKAVPNRGLSADASYNCIILLVAQTNGVCGLFRVCRLLQDNLQCVLVPLPWTVGVPVP